LWPISWTRLRFRISEPATVTVRAGSQRWTKKAKAPGIVSFWLKSRPQHYVVVAQDAAGNVARLKR